MFSPVYETLVLDAGYRNWKRLYLDEFWAVQRAHLVGLAERGIVDAATARAIGRAVDELEAAIAWPDHVPPETEDLYFHFERELGLKVGRERAAFLHTARSRNDMDNTIFRLCLKKKLADFARELLAALRDFIARARETSDDLTILFTHGQPANVSTMGHYLSAFAGDFAQDLRGLLNAIDAVDRSTMGACAITGTGFPLDRERVAELLGFPGMVTNTYRAISSAHWLTKPAAAIEELLCDYTRIAADLLHKASSEVGIVSFPDALIQISSIMPQKRNPVIIEHIRIQAGLAAAASASVRELMRNVPYQDVNEASDAPVSVLIDSLATASSATSLLREALINMRPNDERVRRIALDFGVTTTELADTLVRREGVGFRDAHAACSAFAGSGGDKAALRTAFAKGCGRELTLSDAEIEEALSPEGFVAVRKLPGGPAPEGMAPVFGELDSWAADCAAAIAAIDARNGKARASLAEAWARIVA